MPDSGDVSSDEHQLQRSSSLVSLPEGQKRKRSKAESRKAYRGRMSLGASANRNLSIALKAEQRRKSRQNYDDEDDRDYSYLPPTSSSHTINRQSSEQEGRLSSRNSGRLFNCIPLEDNQENISPTTSARRLSNVSLEWEEVGSPHSIGEIERRRLHNVFSFVKDGKEERHKLGDYLWLALKAYFAGKDVRGRFDAAVIYDPQICMLRTQRIEVIQEILNFRLEHEFSEETVLTQEYLQVYIKKQMEIGELMEKFARFESLFPHRAAMKKQCEQRGILADLVEVEGRLDVLNAWMNTTEQLCDKVEQLGQMLCVSQNAQGKEGWPRPRHGTAPSNIDSISAIVSSFVAEMLKVKGMKRVLTKVSTMCEELLLRATVLLQQPASSYAQAAAVRIQMVLEWLRARSVVSMPDGSEIDPPSLKTFVEEARGCIEEAVRLKRHYLDTIAYTCKNVTEVLDPEYDKLLVSVFQNYRCYVSKLAAAFAQPSHCLFTLLERQWSSAWSCAPFIDGGIKNITDSFCEIMCTTMKRVVVKFWEAGVYRITQGIDDGSVESISDGESAGNEKEIRRRRQLNTLVREAQERAARTFQVIKTMTNNLMTASCFVVTQDNRAVAKSLQDHVLLNILAPDHSENAWPISLLCKPTDHGTLLHLLTTVYHGGVPDSNHLIVLPIPYENFTAEWQAERATLTVCQKIADNLKLFRTDRVVVIGTMLDALHRRSPTIYRHCSQNSAPHSHIHQQMIDFANQLDSFSQDIVSKLYEVTTHKAFYDADNKRAAHSTLLTMFNFAFHYYREVGRIVWEVHELRSSFAKRCVVLLENWKNLVPSLETHYSSNVPLWAKVAFNFMQHISEPQWTQHMNDDIFVRLRSILEFCMNSSQQVECQTPAARRDTITDSGYVSPRATQQAPKDRAEMLRDAADKTDLDIEQRRIEKNILQLGRVLNYHQGKNAVSNVYEIQKAPFQFQLLEKIGEGNFGDVYKALNMDKCCVIAVKKIRARGAERLKILKGEVDILRNLSHQNLVRYYGMEVQGDEVLLLMEYCAEGTLEKICREGMDMTLVRRYTNHLLQAVQYIHEKLVIHRDIKPANIFLDLSCVLKLGDFGSSIRLSANATFAGEFKEMTGTPSYMAPETFTGGQVMNHDEDTGTNTYRGYGRAVDIWSVGCVVLEMVTGARPWDKCDMYQIALNLGNKKRPAYPANCLPLLRHFLDLCLEFDDRARPSATRMLQDPFVNIHTDPQGTIERHLFS
ncbi:unnamed protein product, partial [Mesorhabditis spiculigera]